MAPPPRRAPGRGGSGQRTPLREGALVGEVLFPLPALRPHPPHPSSASRLLRRRHATPLRLTHQVVKVLALDETDDERALARPHVTQQDLVEGTGVKWDALGASRNKFIRRSEAGRLLCSARLHFFFFLPIQRGLSNFFSPRRSDHGWRTRTVCGATCSLPGRGR